jgi:hypothetical protein
MLMHEDSHGPPHSRHRPSSRLPLHSSRAAVSAASAAAGQRLQRQRLQRQRRGPTTGGHGRRKPRRYAPAALLPPPPPLTTAKDKSHTARARAQRRSHSRSPSAATFSHKNVAGEQASWQRFATSPVSNAAAYPHVVPRVDSGWAPSVTTASASTGIAGRRSPSASSGCSAVSSSSSHTPASPPTSPPTMMADPGVTPIAQPAISGEPEGKQRQEQEQEQDAEAEEGGTDEAQSSDLDTAVVTRPEASELCLPLEKSRSTLPQQLNDSGEGSQGGSRDALPRLSGVQSAGRDRPSADRGTHQDFQRTQQARAQFFGIFVSAGYPPVSSVAQLRSDLASYALSGLPVSRHESHTALVLLQKHQSAWVNAEGMRAGAGGAATLLRSARNHYIRACCDEGDCVPMPLLLARPNPSLCLEQQPLALNLNDYRIGDKLARAFAEGLVLLPGQGVWLRELRLARLSCSDEGIACICAALRGATELQTLELTGNRLGRGAGASLSRVLAGHSSLRRLEIGAVGLPDHTMAALVHTLRTLPDLTELDLSSNGIGSNGISDGALRRRGLDGTGAGAGGNVHRSATAHAVAQLLESNPPLQRLNLGWNSLRGGNGDFALGGAEVVGRALAANSFLVHLELGWNGVGDSGAEWIAESIRGSVYLTYLGLAHNSIGERGTFVLADAMREDHAQQLAMVLDGNPIGQHGVRAVFRGAQDCCRFGWKRSISILDCNISYTQSRGRFIDRSRPGGHYDLDLSVPFERATAWVLVELAWSQPGSNWLHETLNGKKFDLPEPDEGAVWTRSDYQLPQHGRLSLSYVATPRIPRLADACSPLFVQRLLGFMTRAKQANRLELLKAACREFRFTAEMAGLLLSLFGDSVSRVDATQCMLSRIVDWPNITCQLFDWLSQHELASLQNPSKAGQLATSFVPSNPSGRYKLNLANPCDVHIANALIAVSSEEEITRKAKRHQEHAPLINVSRPCSWRGRVCVCAQ